MERIENAPKMDLKILSDEEKAKIQNELNELLKIPAGMLTWGEARKIRQLEEQLKA
jgi:hypothetical protein